jgi:Fe-S oxidoreductase
MQMDPVNIQFFAIPGIWLLWLLAIISIFIFIRRVTKLIKLLKKAKPEIRWDNLKIRIKNFLVYVLGQKRLFNERSIGLPHFLFFWGFIFYAGSFGWNLLKGLLPFLPIPYADEIPVISFILEIFGVLVLISIIVAVVRRSFFPPPHLQKSIDAAIILTLISILMITLVLGQGYKASAEGHLTLSPIGNILASGFAGMPASTAFGMNTLMWWIHMITVLLFLAYIPYSKHMHLLVSPFNVLFSNIHNSGNLSVRGGGENISEGSSKWNDFTWKDLLNAFSCAECGRCDRVCPALNSGYKLSPRLILHNLKEHVYSTGLGGNGKVNIDIKSEGDKNPLIGKLISEEELWQCTTCSSCMEQCPVLNEHIPVIINMRRHLVSKGSLDPTLQDMLTKMARYGNSFGQSDRNRAKWTKELDFKIKDARKEEVEHLWILGDYASFDARLKNITKIVASIFQKAGLDFGILYEGERNSGNDVRRIGEEGLFEILKERNIQSLQKAKFKYIFTTDPHTYNTLKNEYELTFSLFSSSKAGTDNGKNGKFQIKHYTELLDELIQQKKITINKKLNYSVTYHDPCYLGRYNNVYDAPRRILKSLGVILTEMPRNRSKSFCCGAGGGKIWMEDKTPVKERPSENRIKEAVALDNVKDFIVACPKDIVMFQDAAKTTGYEEKIKIKDISELVYEATE